MRAFALALLIAFAGCLAPAKPHASSTATIQPDASATSGATQVDHASPTNGTVQQDIRHFAASYDLMEQDISIGGGHNSQGNNCVMLTGDLEIVRGNATVTWTPQPGVSPDMEVVFLSDQKVVAVGTGSSSAAIQFTNAHVSNGPHEAKAPIAWQVDGQQPAGVAIQMQGHLTLAFDYRAAEAAIVESNWGCAIGH